MKKVIGVLILSILYTLAFAQTTGLKKADAEADSYKQWEIGINAGVANFTGEYNFTKFGHTNEFNTDLNFGLGATVRKNLSQLFALELGYDTQTLSGDWKLSTPTSTDFKTRINEVSVNSVWNLSSLLAKAKNERKMLWYAKLGIGATHVSNRMTATHSNGDNWKFITIPVSTGVSYKVSERVKVNVGAQWSFINTDLLDGERNPTISDEEKPLIVGSKLYSHVGVSYSFGRINRENTKSGELPRSEPRKTVRIETRPDSVSPNQTTKNALVGEKSYVYFDFNRSDLNKSSKKALDQLVRMLTENPDVKLEVKSFTDPRGSAVYNLSLSARRGLAVVNYLVSKGIAPDRIQAYAMGISKTTTTTERKFPSLKDEYAFHRRTEATIID